MKLIAGALAVATAVSLAAAPAQARWRGHGHGGWHHHHGGGGAVVGGLLAGALIGGAIAASQQPRYYGPAPAYGYGPPPGDAVGYCMSRFKSYDPASGTYLGYDGYRHPCP
jgi:hypothetical protein